MPLRHYEWGANMNHSYCCGYGYGTAVTQPFIFAAMDRLGIAQYLSRIGLQLDDNSGVCVRRWQGSLADAPGVARRAPRNGEPLRHQGLVRILIAQNLVFDGLLVSARSIAAIST